MLDATRAITMFRQLKVPVLGMIENMSFFDVVAYLRERGGPEAHKLIDGKSFFDTPGDERVYIFGRGGARRKAEADGRALSWARCRSTSSSARAATKARWSRPCFPARPPGPICWASSNSSPPRSASRTSRLPRCPSWRSRLDRGISSREEVVMEPASLVRAGSTDNRWRCARVMSCRQIHRSSELARAWRRSARRSPGRASR